MCVQAISYRTRFHGIIVRTQGSWTQNVGRLQNARAARVPRFGYTVAHKGRTHNKSSNAISAYELALNVLDIIRNPDVGIIPSNRGGALRWADVACRCFLLSRAYNYGIYRASFHYIINILIDIIYVYTYTVYIYSINTTMCEKRACRTKTRNTEIKKQCEERNTLKEEDIDDPPLCPTTLVNIQYIRELLATPFSLPKNPSWRWIKKTNTNSGR